MDFQRILKHDSTIELQSTKEVVLKYKKEDLTFKQFDVGASVVELELLNNGSPAIFDDEIVMATYKIKTSLFDNGTPVCDCHQNQIKSYATIVGDNVIDIPIPSEVLCYQIDTLSDVVMELIIFKDGVSRMTSPALKFKLSPSLSNRPVTPPVAIENVLLDSEGYVLQDKDGYLLTVRR